MKEDSHSASVIVVTLHVATTAQAKSVDDENKAAQDNDDDVDGIIAKALQYVGIECPTSAIDCSSPASSPLSSTPIRANDNYKVRPMIRTQFPTNELTSNIKSKVVPTRCIRIIKACSHITLRRRRQAGQTLGYFTKYVQFDKVNPDRTASIATAVVHAAADVTASNTTRNDCGSLPRRKGWRGIALSSSFFPSLSLNC